MMGGPGTEAMHGDGGGVAESGDQCQNRLRGEKRVVAVVLLSTQPFLEPCRASVHCASSGYKGMTSLLPKK